MKNKILLICILTILLTTYVNAFGVSAFYWEERPLILNPGQITEIQFLLQNEKTSPPVILKAELTTGADISELTGNTVFPIKPGQSGIPLNIKVTIPETAQIGDKYKVGVLLTTAVSQQGGEMLEVGTQIGKSIPIVVGKVVEPKKSIFDIIPKESLVGILVILALAALVVFVTYRKKKKK